MSTQTISIETFKNKHKGETCYIVGSGKTLSQFNELPEEGVIICGNQGWFHPFVFENMTYLVTEGLYEKVFETVSDDIVIFYEPDAPPFPADKQFISTLSEKKNAVPLRFHQDIDYNHTTQLGTHVHCMGYLCAFLANYMGFEKVYLVGMDCDPGRFYTGIQTFASNYNVCIDGWKALKNHLSHIEFVGINPVNLKEVFPEVV